MTLKNSNIVIGAITFALIIGAIVTGCMTRKVTTVTGTSATGFTTNTTTVVDEVNLQLDCEGIRIAAAGLVTVAIQKTGHDAKVIQALTDAHTGLDGALHGLNTNTLAQVEAQLKGVNNPQLTQEVDSFALSVSKLEQGLVQKYGATVGGEIAQAITQAITDGIGLGLGL